MLFPAFFPELIGDNKNPPRCGGDAVCHLREAARAALFILRINQNTRSDSNPEVLPMNGRRSPASRGAMAGLVDGDLAYIRNGGDGREELYDQRSDPAEARDLAADPARAGDVTRLREAMDRLGAAPARKRKGHGR